MSAPVVSMEEVRLLGSCAIVPQEGVVRLLLLAYTVLPIVATAVLVLISLARWRLHPLVVPVILSVVINEGLLKPLLAVPRPVGSCEFGYGMPSGHSLVSALYFLHAAYHLLPSTAHAESMLRAAPKMVGHAVMWLPVPVTRVIVLAHSVPQVCAGMFMGLLAAAAVVLWNVHHTRLE